MKGFDKNELSNFWKKDEKNGLVAARVRHMGELSGNEGWLLETKRDCLR